MSNLFKPVKGELMKQLPEVPNVIPHEIKMHAISLLEKEPGRPVLNYMSSYEAAAYMSVLYGRKYTVKQVDSIMTKAIMKVYYRIRRNSELAKHFKEYIKPGFRPKY